MFQSARLFVLFGIAPLWPACAHAAQTNRAGEEMLAALSDASDENDRHADACASAPSMDDMLNELTAHDSTMGDIMLRMDDARDNMRAGSMMSTHCSGSSFDHMSTSLGDMHAAMESHTDRMHRAASLDDARAECAAHTDTARDMMDSMHDDVEGMPCMQM